MEPFRHEIVTAIEDVKLKSKHGLTMHCVLLKPLVKGGILTRQSPVNGKCFICSTNMYIKNYICSIFESWREIKLSRLNSLKVALLVIMFNCKG